MRPLTLVLRAFLSPICGFIIFLIFFYFLQMCEDCIVIADTNIKSNSLRVLDSSHDLANLIHGHDQDVWECLFFNILFLCF